jgi:hypothetical protein
LLACNEGSLLLPEANQPAALTLLQGNAQTAIVGGTLPESLIVRVTDSRQLPVAQIRVAFVLMTPSAGGSLAPDTALTDKDGRAASRWILGPSAGAQRVDARIVGNNELVASFSATATAGTVASFAIVKGDKQSAPAGTTLPDSLVVRALDAQNNPIIGQVVNWTITGGGSLTTDQVPTGPDGRAAVRRTLGPTAGVQTTIANAGNVPGSPLTFTSTATAGEAATLALVTQPASTAQSGVQLTRQPRVQLRDGLGNPVAQSGLVVTAELATGPGATLTGDPTRATDGTGLAAFTDLAIDGPPGTYTLRFSATGVPPVVSSAIQVTVGAVSASRSSLTVDPSSITVFGNKSTITVIVRDGQGNPISGATVVPSSSDPGNSTITPASGTTNGSGVATFSFGATAAKDYTISARANDVLINQTQKISVKRAATTTAISSFQPASSTALQELTVGFSVTSSGSGAPTGTVTVTDGSVSCSAPVTQRNCTLTPATAGTKTFKATYSGDGNFQPSSGQQSHPIDLVPTKVPSLISSDGFGSVVGQSVTFTALVQAETGVADGKVNFRENSCGAGGAALGTGPLEPTGDLHLSKAEFTTKTLTEGSHLIFACYPGTQTFAGSVSDPITQDVGAAK